MMLHVVGTAEVGNVEEIQIFNYKNLNWFYYRLSIMVMLKLRDTNTGMLVFNKIWTMVQMLY